MTSSSSPRSDSATSPRNLAPTGALESGLRVLFISPCVPWPANRGGRVRTEALLTHLAARHHIDLWCVREPGASLPPSRAFGGHLRNLRVFERGQRFSLRRWSYAGPERWFASEGLRRALDTVDREGDYDLIHFDEPSLLRPHRASELRTPCVVHHHKLDVEVARQAREIGLGPSPRELRRLRSMEAHSARVSGHHITASPLDARILRERHSDLRVTSVPCGIEPARFLEIEPRRDAERPPRILLFGSLDYGPNVDALRFALRGPWPRLLEEHPRARLRVMGSGESAEVEELCRGGMQVELVGEVEDPRPILAGADLLFAPHRIGSGTRLKILEALAAGCPVVATPRAAEGLDLEPGVHLTLGRDADELLGGMLEVLADPVSARQGAARGRTHVLATFAWPALAEEVAIAWSRAIAEHAR